MQIPSNVLVFEVKTSLNPMWDKYGPKLLHHLEVTETFQQEMRRVFYANCFNHEGWFVCNWEAIYSIVRVLFAISPNNDQNDWPFVSQVVRHFPMETLEALGLEVTQHQHQNDFFLFKLNGTSSTMSLDLTAAAQAVVAMTKRTK